MFEQVATCSALPPARGQYDPTLREGHLTETDEESSIKHKDKTGEKSSRYTYPRKVRVVATLGGRGRREESERERGSEVGFAAAARATDANEVIPERGRWEQEYVCANTYPSSPAPDARSERKRERQDVVCVYIGEASSPVCK